ncbi:hypothetical protein TNCV_1085041 [Trichonephila clavipes]|nr:hypothetical protein TNCV_1085041 [Trichonephila clavipes]
MWQHGLIGSTANARVLSQKQSAFTSRREQLESVSSTRGVIIGGDVRENGRKKKGQRHSERVRKNKPKKLQEDRMRQNFDLELAMPISIRKDSGLVELGAS